MASPTARLFKRKRQLLVRKPTFETRFFFTLLGTNGEPVAQSEAYNSKQAAQDTLKMYFPNFTVNDQTADKGV